MPTKRGRDLFNVGNSVEGRTGLRYLQEWCEIARAFDIATGYFEIGTLLALDPHRQGLERIRIPMDADMIDRSRAAILDAIRARAARARNDSVEFTKPTHPFSTGAPAVLEALRARQTECRACDRDKLHANAGIADAKRDVVGSQTLGGSSHSTAAGLAQGPQGLQPLRRHRPLPQDRLRPERKRPPGAGDRRGHRPTRRLTWNLRPKHPRASITVRCR
jgi:hypothetical protein